MFARARTLEARCRSPNDNGIYSREAQFKSILLCLPAFVIDFLLIYGMIIWQRRNKET